MNIKREMKIEFSEFGRALLASLRIIGVRDFVINHSALRLAIEAALEIGVRDGVPFSFNTQTPGILANEWLSTCSLYGLLGTCSWRTARLVITLDSSDVARDYLDDMIGDGRLKIAYVGSFKAMAEAFVKQFDKAARGNYERKTAATTPRKVNKGT